MRVMEANENNMIIDEYSGDRTELRDAKLLYVLMSSLLIVD